MNEVESSAPSDVTQPAQEVVTQQTADTPPWKVAPETTAPQQEQPKQPDPAAPERKSGYQRRIDELVREREYERAEKQRLHDLLAKQTQQASQPEKAQQPAQGNAEPQIEDFDKYEKYIAAYARWEAKAVYDEQRRIELEQRQKEQEETQKKTTIEEQHKQIEQQQASLTKMTAEAQKKYADFYETVFEQDPATVPISPIVAQAIIGQKDGYEVAYFLGKNPAEAQRIAQLSPIEQLVEFGSIKASLKAKQSAAPAPISPVSGKVGGNELPNNNDDMATWIAKRNRQLGRK